MITLTCRLLCASRVAYAVTTNAAPAACPPYDGIASFLAPPTGFVSGPDAIDACCVGTNSDGVILAFRGTLPPDSPNHEQTFDDWLNDADALLVSKPPLGGKVHEGFWNALDALYPRLFLEVRKQLSAAPGQPLTITGHSKGGAMANLAAVRLALDGIPNTVCTFAAAHPGNRDFAAFYARLITPTQIQSSTRYEYADDVVPHLPPGLALRQAMAAVGKFSKYVAELDTKPTDEISYEPVGTLRFIDWSGNIVGNSPTLPISRALHLAELVVQLQFDQIIHDHTIDCGGGYATAICPTGVCA